MPQTIESDLQRILKARNADIGLFILAMHSLIERCLRKKYGYENRNYSIPSSTTFGELINNYANDYYNQHGVPQYKGATERCLPKNEWEIFKTLREIYTNHYLANDVRHQFEEKEPEAAQSTVKCFLAFAKAENWNYPQALAELKKELTNWDKHSAYQSQELTRLINQIDELKRKNENLAEKANKYAELENRLKVLEAKEGLLNSQLKEQEGKLSKKDKKIDEIRKKTFEESQKFRNEKKELLEELKRFDNTKKYLSYLERVSFYTKTRHDYESSVIKLTPEQQDILEQIKLNSDFLVKGAAGTGKSLVLLKALEKAVNEMNSELDFGDNGKPFRLLTYTKSLVKYNQYVTQILGTNLPAETITTADSFLYSMLKKFFPSKSIFFYLDKEYEKVFSTECAREFSPEEIFRELNEFIWANCITKEDYTEKLCDRTGMKNPIKKNDRIKIWQALEEIEERLEAMDKWPRNFAAKKIIQAMENALSNGDSAFLAEYSFVDEAQDLPPVILAMIKKSTKRCVFLAGDSDQSIYRKGFNWNMSGIDIKGRTKILKTNFRNTNQIHEFAEKYRERFKHMDKATQPSAFRPGPPVELSGGKDTADLIEKIVQQVKLLMNALNYEEENICIIANENKKLDDIQKLLDKEIGIASKKVADADFDFATSKGIRLCTSQNCKGLDFPVVLLLADHRVHGMEKTTAFDEETYYEQQYNMVYVCLTRAMEMLHIFTVDGTTFGPFKDLKEINR